MNPAVVLVLAGVLGTAILALAFAVDNGRRDRAADRIVAGAVTRHYYVRLPRSMVTPEAIGRRICHLIDDGYRGIHVVSDGDSVTISAVRRA